MLTTIFLIQAGFFLFTAAAAFSRPGAFAATLGLKVNGAAGVNEIRAQYGGFFAAAGAVEVAAALKMASATAGLLVGAVIFGGLVAGRYLAVILNQGIAGLTTVLKALLVIDFVGLMMNLAAYRWAT